ncbi:HAD family hydrolase [Thermodesulfobacteriota bacterium]
MTYRLVIFDLDGTLIDSRASIVTAFRAVARDLGMPGEVFPDGEAYIGYALNDVLEKLRIADVARARELYRHYYYQYIHPRSPLTVLLRCWPTCRDGCIWRSLRIKA